MRDDSLSTFLFTIFAFRLLLTVNSDKILASLHIASGGRSIEIINLSENKLLAQTCSYIIDCKQDFNVVAPCLNDFIYCWML